MTGVQTCALPIYVLTNQNGTYSKFVPHTWSGTVAPAKAGMIFYPEFYSYTNVISALIDQDFSGYNSFLELVPYQIPSGWSGFSSYIVPCNSSVEEIFSSLDDNFVILQNFEHIYWPGGGVNTIVSLDNYSGYSIKLANQSQLDIIGESLTLRSLNLNPGWNYLPVLNACANDADSLLSPVIEDLVIVKEIAGWRMFWPSQDIYTLDYLIPGKAYLILLASQHQIEYPECNFKSYSMKDKQNKGIHDLPGFENIKNELIWDEPIPTPVSHSICMVLNEFLAKKIKIGSVIGAFTEELLCGGLVIYQPKQTGLTLFADDPTTPEKDGFIDGEPIFFKMYDPETKVETNLVAEFDPTLPDYDGTFKTNGLSAIRSLKAEATAIIENQELNIRIFPNPAHDRLNIIIGMAEIAEVKFLNIHGQPIKSLTLTTTASLVDISDLPDGMYLIEIVVSDNKTIKRFIKN